MRFRLVPTDDRFFSLFNESAQNVELCAQRLLDLVRTPDSEELFERVQDCERRGDQFTTDILHRLDTTFVTPFDREDIHALAEELDDVVDDIYQVAALLRVVGVKEPLLELVEQAQVLVKMAQETTALVDRLESMKDTKGLLDSIDRLESDGDAVYRRALGRLFSGEFDALDVIKWKDIVSAMEGALNTLEDIGDVVESIVLKHA
jgi:predicted phosphate transport protein (TIGR00153 family)